MRASMAWLMLILTSAALLAAMAWVTHLSLAMERTNQAIQREVATQAAARQALLRMDSAALEVVVDPRGMAELSTASQAKGNGDAPSPFLRFRLATFDVRPDGHVHWDGSSAGEVPQQLVTHALAQAEGLASRTDAASADISPSQASGDQQVAQQARLDPLVTNRLQQSRFNMDDFTSRSQIISQNAVPQGDVSASYLPPAAVAVEGRLLLLWKRTGAAGAPGWRGCVLDWPALREHLLAQVKDILPHASLALLTPDQQTAGHAGELHRLAVLPVSLFPGSPGELPTDEWVASGIGLSLAVAWGSLLAAITAMALLLAGVMRLSARRAAFVQAVTHEMRTPLTTFRLYTDLLSQGRVASEDRRQQYLSTLQREAQRLSQMVENVLAYARLERRASAIAAEPVTLGRLVDRAWDRLACRAQQAGMTLVREDGAAGDALVLADVGVVEQILLNLVDNACKYAADANDRTIRLQLATDGSRGRLMVRDHGPGVSMADRKSLFKAFSRLGPAHGGQAADAPPGVGLGLSLCRQLARTMGGELSLTPVEGGATFTLSLRKVTG